MENKVQAGRRATVPVALLAIIVAYGVALCVGWPQSGTQQIVNSLHHHAEPAAAGKY